MAPDFELRETVEQATGSSHWLYTKTAAKAARMFYTLIGMMSLRWSG